MPKLKYDREGLVYHLLNNKVVIILSNFIFQGMRYMSFGERLFKLLFTLFPAIVFFLYTGMFILGVFIFHSINFLLNGHYFVLYRYFGKKSTISKQSLKTFLIFIDNNINHYQISEVLIYGSFCRDAMKPTSDLDIRIYHESDFKHALLAYFFGLKLRFWGFITKFPVDAYCFSNSSFLKKVSKDEIPAIFRNNEEMRELYPNAHNFKKHFDKINITEN